jgi:hypothetical protein
MHFISLMQYQLLFGNTISNIYVLLIIKDNDAGGEEEDQQNNYIYDDFTVRDADINDKDKQVKKKKREFSRLQRRNGDVALEEEDLLLIEDNAREQFEGREESDKDDMEEENGDEDKFIAPETAKAAKRRGYIHVYIYI